MERKDTEIREEVERRKVIVFMQNNKLFLYGIEINSIHGLLLKSIPFTKLKSIGKIIEIVGIDWEQN